MSGGRERGTICSYTPCPSSRHAIPSHRLEGLARVFMLPSVRRIIGWAGNSGDGERRTGWYSIGWWWSLPGEDPSDAMEVNVEARGELIINDEDAIGGVPDPW